MTTSKKLLTKPNSERSHLTHSFSMSRDLYTTLDNYAAQSMLSKSRIVQEALKMYLDVHYPLRGK